ncbi:hypothetical protein D9599_07265 [Roseomonas sp. KE2513]|uniref:hypothetical protein n=1 Tax=Roseomonas sp. KE2513 TaxID=2479202 RepID=UPI0018DFBA6D|nr:hypothetical protein [Roseomonas sp. KE2513]MBI0535366.1 hypothetical protein [Roseomonas sp. KE2513]
MGLLAGYAGAAPPAAAPMTAAHEVRRRLMHRDAGEARWLLEERARGHALFLSGNTRTGARHSLAFDGRLTNRAELLADLRAAGVEPEGTGDADAILAGWETWDEALLPRLEGAFAIAILDTATGILTLVRDRFGQSPLLVATIGGRDGAVAFASELQALLAWPGLRPEPDLAALSTIIAFGYSPLGCSPLMRVRRLPPGHLMVVGADGSVRERRWWSMPATSSEPVRPARSLTPLIIAALKEQGLDEGAVTPRSGEGTPLLLACMPGVRESTAEIPPPDPELVQRLVLHQGEPIAPDAILPALAAGAEGGLLLAPTGAAELLLAHRRYRLVQRDLAKLREGSGTKPADGGFHEAPLSARDLWHAASGGMAEGDRMGLLGPALLHTLVLAAPDLYGTSLCEADPAFLMAEAARLDLSMRVPARELPALDVAASLTGATILCPFLESRLSGLLLGLPDAARRWLVQGRSPVEADLSAWNPMAPALRDFTEETLLGSASRNRHLFSQGCVPALLRRHKARQDLDPATLWAMLGVELWCQAFLDGNAWKAAAKPAQDEVPAAVREAA